MIISFGEGLDNVNSDNSFGVTTREIFFTRKNFVVHYQWVKAHGAYRPDEKFCSFVTYSRWKDGSIHACRECHLGKTIFVIEYKSPKMAHMVDVKPSCRPLLLKGSFKGMLKAIFR